MADPSLVPVNNTADSFQVWINKFNSVIADLQTNVVTVSASATGVNTTGNALINGIFGAVTLVTNNLRGGNVQTNAVLTVISNVSIGNSTSDNVTLGFGRLQIGNVAANTTQINVGPATINTSTFAIGVATVNSSLINVASATHGLSIAVGANVSLNTSVMFIGNATVNTVINSSFLQTNTANLSGQLKVGSNVAVNSSIFFVGNATVNVVINSSAVSISGQQVQAGPGVTTSISAVTSGTGLQPVDWVALASYRAVEYVLMIDDQTANNKQACKALMLHVGGASYLTEYSIISSNNNLGSFSTSVNATSVILNFTPTSTSTNIKGYRLAVPV